MIMEVRLWQVKQQEEMQLSQNNDEHVSPDDTLSDKAESGNKSEKGIRIDTGTYQEPIRDKSTVAS